MGLNAGFIGLIGNLLVLTAVSRVTSKEASGFEAAASLTTSPAGGATK
jgi:hypothetical protein